MECFSNCCESRPAVSVENDPTLADCCMRDLQEQKYVQSVKEKLLSYDRTNERMNIANNAILREVDQRRVEGDQDEDTDSLATDSDGEPDLQEARERRLRQLQKSTLLQERAALQGAGSLQDVSQQNLQRVIEETAAAAVVCHLSMTGVEADEQLDEILTTLAHQYRGTAFLRTPLSGPRSPLLTHLGLLSASGLVCFNKGILVGSSPLETLGSCGDIYEENVIRFLKGCRVLHESLSRPLKDSEVSDDSEGEESDWQEPCAVCGRRYYHEHVRSVSKGNVDLDGFDEEGA